MRIRHSAYQLQFAILSLSWTASWQFAQHAAAQQPSQAPAAQTQSAAQTPQAPADEKPKYTPEQRQQLDRASDLLKQVSKLNDQGKYRDAIPLAAEALKLREAVLGPVDDPLIANACAWLGFLHQNAGNCAEALPLYQRALNIDEKAFGPDHPDVAAALNNLAGLYRAQGNYAEALPLFQRSLKIDEKALGPDHPDVATDLNDLALLYKAQGNYAEALPLYQRALKIDEKALGPEHPLVATSLFNLAELYRAQGNYAEALPLFQRSLKIDEKALGPDHPDVATDLNDLALLYKAQGNYAEALPLYQRALKIREKTLGPDHPDVAGSLFNLAKLYQAQGNYAEALPLYQRALKMRETALGPQHPDVAVSLNNLAVLYEAQGNYAEALPLYQRSLKIDEKALGPDHPDVATDLNNLASLSEAQGNYAEALPLYQRSLKILEKALGPDHPDVAAALNNLAGLYRAQGNYAEALPLYQRTAETTMRHLELTAAVQSERQQLENIKTSRWYLDTFVSCALLEVDQSATAPAPQPSAGGRGSEVYAQMLAWKGSVLLRQRLERLARHSDDPDEQNLWQQLQSVSTRLATASLAAPSPNQRDAWQENLVKLTRDKEDVEAQLSGSSAEFRRLRLQSKLTPDEVAKDLPADTALVDLLQFYRRVNEKQPDGTIKTHWEQRLAAFVLRPDLSVAMIDLALIGPINESVEQWRESYGGNLSNLAPEEQPGMKLRRLVWEPIAKHLGGIKTVLISPDGEVAKFPWASLPGSRPNTYLIEDGIAIAFIPIPQMLADLLDDKKAVSDQTAPTLLIVGDVNYDTAPGDRQRTSSETPPEHPTVLLAAAEHRAAVRGKDGMKFQALPGTAQEIERIEELYRARFGANEPLELRQSAATQQRLREEAPKYRYLHLATHGFFAPPTVRSALAQDQQSSQSLQTGQEREVVGFNPGLLAGLALAGANWGSRPESSTDPTAPPADDGIMTALEVASLDLQNVDLVTLSACETGLGQSTGGEGMLGLQRAFQVAGAKTTISSLWSVDDAATQTLMAEFYQRLWDKEHPLGKLEALQQAQLEMLHHYDPRTKKLVDRGRGLELNSEPSDNNGRLSPKYWAAFELSGDWR